jgi:hypothetical protein
MNCQLRGQIISHVVKEFSASKPVLMSGLVARRPRPYVIRPLFSIISISVAYQAASNPLHSSRNVDQSSMRPHAQTIRNFKCRYDMPLGRTIDRENRMILKKEYDSENSYRKSIESSVVRWHTTMDELLADSDRTSTGPESNF